MDTTTPATADPRLDSIEHRVVRHGRVTSLDEAASARGVQPHQVVKTMVVRVSDEEHIFVLVPGDRVIDWPLLRKALGVRRLTVADGGEARSVTGYLPGTITPFGSKHDLDVYADSRIAEGEVSIGGGAPGVGLAVDGNDLVEVLNATVIPLTKPR